MASRKAVDGMTKVKKDDREQRKTVVAKGSTNVAVAQDVTRIGPCYSDAIARRGVPWWTLLRGEEWEWRRRMGVEAGKLERSYKVLFSGDYKASLMSTKRSKGLGFSI